MAHRFHLVEQFDVSERLEHIRVPTLIMAGDRDLLVSEGSLNRLLRGVSGAKLVRLRRCGHLAFVTHAHRVAEEVKRFLLDEEGF
jgi:pimeloyl-ACP methyl ester carboxylesterase